MNLIKSSPAEIAENFIRYTSKNIFLTGKAGTGKTTLLKKIISSTYKKTIVAAPTGIAALNAGGVTLHSQFQLPLGGFLPTFGNLIADGNVKFETKATLGRHLRMNNHKRKTLCEAELLIIDEVSMLRADILDAIDFVLQKVRRNNTAFGGVQVLFIGDLLQLPPVVKKEEWQFLREFYYSPFFFAAKVLEQNPPVYIELNKIYRQQDKTFTDVLNSIRYNEIQEEDVEILNRYYIPNFKPKAHEGFVTLTTHNRFADSINQNELNQLRSVSYNYHALIENDFPENIFPCDKTLVLKEGAQVMFTKNDYQGGRYFNGKTGVVKSLDNDAIIVETDTHKNIEVERFTWTNIRYSVDENTREIKEEVLGTFSQFPLRLAWAITIHKSQGLTFDKAIIDVKNVFAAGQTYVALSRLRSLDGLVLSTPFSTRGIANDQTVISFEETKNEQGDLSENFQQSSLHHLQTLSMDCYNLSGMLREWNNHLLSYNKLENLSEKQKHLEWAQTQYESIKTIAETSAKFLNQLKQIFAQRTLDKPYLIERLNAAQNYFNQPLKKVCAEVFLHKRKMQLGKTTKTYAEELDDLDSMLMNQLRLMHQCESLASTVLNNQTQKDDNLDKFDTSWRTALAQITVEAPQKPEKKKKEKGETYRTTLALYKEGKLIEEIAQERNLGITTIEGHFARLIEQGEIKILKVMSYERWSEIKHSIEENQGLSNKELHTQLQEKFSFGEIKMVIASLSTDLEM
ncbi:MAG TPA: helix-turn-helix domain-containing protein [Chitinophagales bacterium]|nr:helix-turn-helix domain-containing protein [Chitinophagales bacterium]